MSIALDPTVLPALDIISLAQSGKILRAERTTEQDGIPCFILRKDWDRLKSRDGKGNTLSDETLLRALEKISARFLQEAAKACKLLGNESHQNALPSTFEIESDLFPHRKKVFLLLVRDATHPVVCALIGTSSALLDSLRAH
ncbi:hypothetical protein PT277_02665 [Acetobacteraceae bacterium ESL0709]|nr:hypothetical protein [Acetobacteraceae bacterium ESL0697]MDF7677605.1 hypothetical protein [Acetobacteraceae bacterium ESL0709]